jgi:hypothetical protein
VSNGTGANAVAIISDGVSGDALGEDLNHAARDIMPWAAALLVHACLVVGAILTVWVSLPSAEVERIVPISPLVDRSMEVTIHQPAGVGKNRQDNESRSVTRKQTKLASDFKVKTPSLIGVAGSAPSSAMFTGNSPAKGPIGPWGDGVDVNQFISARKIAYVIDASGSMLDTLPFVVLELKRTINQLGKNHSFTVIFYQGERIFEAGRPGLKVATSSNKQAVFSWMDEHVGASQGLSNPIKAIRTALNYKPEVMFLLSDNITGRGIYTVGQNELLAALKQANVGGTKVNTIQFLYPDPMTKVAGMKGSMELISQETGGVYRFLSSRELGIR